ncbi:MAG TPA: DUF6390 family protein [Candidatus Limnocylindria bacterium]|jgi:hypothetical protein|nr:DUF6390 family protein [Candidatus Limnocylindria bacterium]
MAEASGPVLFARYAYPPNRMGLCGPDDAPSLREAALAAEEREVRALARGFEGAFPYLELIAREGGVPDPLDRRVVEAYWLGGGLVSRVGPRALHRSVDDRFRRRMSKDDWGWLQMAVQGGSRPVHAFHVLEIYPRAGLMRGGDAGNPVLDTMDACRIRWGTVLAVEGDRLVVRAPRLELRDGLLRIGPQQVETVSGWVDGAGVLGGASAGDHVSLHWGWACDRLTDRQLRRLRTWTRAALEVANQAI